MPLEEHELGLLKNRFTARLVFKQGQEHRYIYNQAFAQSQIKSRRVADLVSYNSFLVVAAVTVSGLGALSLLYVL